MGFLSGRVTFLRFRVSGAAPRSFGEEHLDKLNNYAAGRKRLSYGGVEAGWCAGDHILDTGFNDVKNLIDNALVFGLRIDQDELPKDLMFAHYQIELGKLARGNPSGFPSARQKREAKEIAREEIEEQAKDGRYRKHKAIPVLWDRLSNEVLFGATAVGHVDKLCSLFEQTFHRDLECVTAGPRAFHLAEVRGQTRQVDDSAMSAFIPGVTSGDVAWIADESSRDFLGNEFLLWLWYYTQAESDTIKLSDGSDVTFMLARSLTLDCPRGQSGHVAATHEIPAKMPEALRSAQTGKLPRRTGLTLVRNLDQYELTLDAETLAVGAAKLPPADEGIVGARPVLEDRIGKIRTLIETLDLLYDAFGRRRFGKEWESELKGMQKWLKTTATP